MDAVNISVGRPDFIAFPSSNNEEWWGAGVRPGEDRVEDIIQRLSGNSDREVGLTIDVLAPRLVAQNSDYQGKFTNGQAAEDFPSAVALHEGVIGERITSLCAEASKRYAPDYIALTELIGDSFFNDADEDLFRTMTGESGFPRDDEGNIKVADDTLNDWQSRIITDVITRCHDASGVPIEMDARVDFEHPGANRFDSGHRYEDILATGSRLSLWAYAALEGEPPEAIGELIDGLRQRFNDEELARFTVSVGLWGDASPEEVQKSLSQGAGMNMSVTPLSMMTDRHWEALNKFSD